jgi:hypothetical protein
MGRISRGGGVRVWNELGTSYAFVIPIIVDFRSNSKQERLLNFNFHES